MARRDPGHEVVPPVSAVQPQTGLHAGWSGDRRRGLPLLKRLCARARRRQFAFACSVLDLRWRFYPRIDRFVWPQVFDGQRCNTCIGQLSCRPTRYEQTFFHLELQFIWKTLYSFCLIIIYSFTIHMRWFDAIDLFMWIRK